MKISNKILIPIVALLFVFCLVGAYVLSDTASGGDRVYVYDDGRLIKTLYLSDEPYTVDLGTNVILVEGDGVSMKSASCPDKLCVKQGKIKSSGRPIVCLPNRITVEISKKGEVDAVSGK